MSRWDLAQQLPPTFPQRPCAAFHISVPQGTCEARCGSELIVPLEAYEAASKKKLSFVATHVPDGSVGQSA